MLSKKDKSGLLCVLILHIICTCSQVYPNLIDMAFRVSTEVVSKANVVLVVILGTEDRLEKMLYMCTIIQPNMN